jgi:micrococcal nuclease
MHSGLVTYQRVTVDRYGRTVAVVWAGSVNLSCWQLEHGQALYKPKWDNGRRIRRVCQ